MTVTKVDKTQQIAINLLALFSSNRDQSSGLVALCLGGIKGKQGVQKGVQNDFLKIET